MPEDMLICLARLVVLTFFRDTFRVYFIFDAPLSRRIDFVQLLDFVAEIDCNNIFFFQIAKICQENTVRESFRIIRIEATLTFDDTTSLINSHQTRKQTARDACSMASVPPRALFQLKGATRRGGCELSIYFWLFRV